MGENERSIFHSWTHWESAVWLTALIATIAVGVLLVTDAVGSWAVLVPSVLGMIMALWRYRVEAKRKKHAPEDQSE